MAFDSMEQRNQIAERQEYLQRLRERAVERMRADERAVTGKQEPAAVSRRESLRWLGMAAVGAVPAVAALVRTERAFAAPPASARSAAPQYGAPSWYAPPAPYPPVPLPGKVTTSRKELADVKIWRDVWVQMVSEKIKEGGIGLDQVAAKEGYYSDGWGGGTHALLAIANPDTDFAYIVRGNQSFYAAVDSDMYACMIGQGVLSMNGSLFRRKGAKDSLAEVIADFSQVGDQEAYRRDRQGTTINLEKGLPQKFWVRNSDDGWALNYIGITYAVRRDDTLTLTVQSNGYPSTAMFTVDLKTRKLLQTSFEGKEWAP